MKTALNTDPTFLHLEEKGCKGSKDYNSLETLWNFISSLTDSVPLGDTIDATTFDPANCHQQRVTRQTATRRQAIERGESVHLKPKKHG